MTNYSEILRLKSLGINHSQIAESMALSRQTFVTVAQPPKETPTPTTYTVAELID